MSKLRLRQWFDMEPTSYVSFSGGKDSTVLLHLARSVKPDCPAVFCNTGLEYPEVVQFVKSCDNITTIRPKLTFKQVIDKYGYPVVSKSQAAHIANYHNTESQSIRERRYKQISKKWKYLLEAPFKIDDACCYHLKKGPFLKYERAHNSSCILGIMATDSQRRNISYQEYGCNIHSTKRPISRPIMFWTQQDIWNYIDKYNLSYSKIYDMGWQNTGCMFCMFGVHLEDEPNRFQRMMITHPKLYNYCINKLGIGKVLDYLGVPYKRPKQLQLFNTTR